MTYYIDSRDGSSLNSGLNEGEALSDYRQIKKIEPGDIVLFRRGSVFRRGIFSPDGAPGKPILYGAYGEGEKPVFSGSVNVSDPKLWMEREPNIWQYTGTLGSEVCNVVFNGGESCGLLAWHYEDLKKQGYWYDSAIGSCEGNAIPLAGPQGFFLYSKGNPGTVYHEVEAAVYGDRLLASGRRHVIFDGLVFRNSGVHGYADQFCEDVTVRNCEFRFIGGGVWNREQHIRFGNAFEMWEDARDCCFEHNICDNIYDSCVTHQGSANCQPPKRVYFRNNLFRNYGMAAYEARDRIGIEVYFEDNTCIGAGEGFAMQDETPPRRSEIWPQPMGHHLFLWRIEGTTDDGCIFVRGNNFDSPPYGAAVYSICSPAAEAQFTMDKNTYRVKAGSLLTRWGGKNYKGEEFASYQEESRQDGNSEFISCD